MSRALKPGVSIQVSPSSLLPPSKDNNPFFSVTATGLEGKRDLRFPDQSPSLRVEFANIMSRELERKGFAVVATDDAPFRAVLDFGTIRGGTSAPDDPCPFPEALNHLDLHLVSVSIAGRFNPLWISVATLPTGGLDPGDTDEAVIGLLKSMTAEATKHLSEVGEWFIPFDEEPTEP